MVGVFRGPPAPTPHSDPSCSNGLIGGGVCCSTTCGHCGGTTCGDEPGGAEHCCSGTIGRTNLSCNDHVAPCVLGGGAGVTSKIISHASFATSNGDTSTKVLVVRKTGSAKGVGSSSPSMVPVEVCANPRLMPAQAWPLRSVARLTRLLGTEGRDTSATHGRLTLAGRTLTGSRDGKWMGDEVSETLQPRDGPQGEVCYDVPMGDYSAALLTLRPR